MLTQDISGKWGDNVMMPREKKLLNLWQHIDIDKTSRIIRSSFVVRRSSFVVRRSSFVGINHTFLNSAYNINTHQKPAGPARSGNAGFVRLAQALSFLAFRMT